MPTGTLKKFFGEKGFGFIAPDDGTGDLFAHRRALLGSNESAIQEGVRVTYVSEIEERTNKPKASTWSIIDGGAATAATLPSGMTGGMMASPVPDYGALAAASFSAYGGIGPLGANRYSPYGAMGAAMPGMAMTAMPMTMQAFPSMPAVLPVGWETVTDPTTGRPYYCNRATGESSWTVPVAAAAPMTMPCVSAAAPMMVAAPAAGTDPATASTAAATTTAATAAAPFAAEAPVAAAAPPVAAAAPVLPAGWETANDPTSGKPYYFNRATGETKWEVPM